jgi:hypothetical protein
MFATISFCTSLAISSQPHTAILVTQHDLVLLVCIWYIIMIMLSVDSSGIFGIGGTAVLNWWWQRPTACPLIIERVWVVGSGNKQIGQAFGKVGDCIISSTTSFWPAWIPKSQMFQPPVPFCTLLHVCDSDVTAELYRCNIERDCPLCWFHVFCFVTKIISIIDPGRQAY